MKKKLNHEAVMELVYKYEEANMGLVEIVEDMQDRGLDIQSIANVIECVDWL